MWSVKIQNSITFSELDFCVKPYITDQGVWVFDGNSEVAVEQSEQVYNLQTFLEHKAFESVSL